MILDALSDAAYRVRHGPGAELEGGVQTALPVTARVNALSVCVLRFGVRLAVWLRRVNTKK